MSWRCNDCVKIITKSSANRLKIFVRLNQKFTWTWDTFAEPNIENNTERKLSSKIRLHPVAHATGPRPKSRITEEGCGWGQLKTCLSWGSETPLQIQWILFFLRAGEKSGKPNIAPLNHLPLLPSDPGGVQQELVVPICRCKCSQTKRVCKQGIVWTGDFLWLNGDGR